MELFDEAQHPLAKEDHAEDDLLASVEKELAFANNNNNGISHDNNNPRPEGDEAPLPPKKKFSHKKNAFDRLFGPKGSKQQTDYVYKEAIADPNHPGHDLARQSDEEYYKSETDHVQDMSDYQQQWPGWYEYYKKSAANDKNEKKKIAMETATVDLNALRAWQKKYVKIDQEKYDELNKILNDEQPARKKKKLEESKK